MPPENDGPENRFAGGSAPGPREARETQDPSSPSVSADDAVAVEPDEVVLDEASVVEEDDTAVIDADISEVVEEPAPARLDGGGAPALPPPPGATPTPPPSLVTTGSLPATEAPLPIGAAATPWGEAVGVYERELDLEADKERRALLEHEVGYLLERYNNDDGTALKRYGKALLADPTLKPNVWALKRICERRGNWQTLLKLIDAEIKFARDDAERGELLVERGWVLWEKMNDAAGARAAFEAASGLGGVETAGTARLPALMALEKMAASTGDAGGLLEVVRRMADAVVEPTRRAALLFDLARLEEATGSGPDDVLARLREAFEIGAHRRPIVAEMERVAAAAERVEEMLVALDLHVAVVDDEAAANPAGAAVLAEEAVAVRRVQAQIAHARDATRAWSYLEDAHRRLPGEAIILSDIAELADELGRWSDLADVLARRVALADGPAHATTRALLRGELARALRRAGRADEALRIEAELEAEAPGYAPLLVERQVRAGAALDAQELGARCREEAALALAGGNLGAPDPTWAAAAYVAAGSLDERRDDDAAAGDAYAKALAARPGYRPAVDALDRLLMRNGRHAERAALIESELERARATAASDGGAASGSRARIEYLLDELIGVRLGPLNDVDGALIAAWDVAELRGNDVASHARIVEICRGAGRWADAAKELDNLAQRLTRAGALERAADARLEQASLLERRLGDVAGATAIYEELARQGRPEAIGELKRLHLAGQRVADVARVVERELDLAPPARTASLLVELGDLYEELGKLDEASRLYRDLLDRVPGHAEALRALARVADRRGDAAELAAALEQSVDGAPGPAAQARELVELGEVYEDRLASAEQAADAYARAAEKAAAAGDVVVAAHAGYARLRGLARHPDARALDGVLATLATGTDARTRAALDEERAGLAIGDNDLDAATARLDAALTADPDLVLALVGKGRVAALRGDAAALGASLASLASRTGDVALGAALAARATTFAAAAGGDAAATARTAIARGTGSAAVDVLAAEHVDDPDLLARRAALATGDAALAWRMDRIEALEARGRLADAAREAQAILVETDRPGGDGASGKPSVPLALLVALRRIARAGGDKKGQAQAAARLARELRDERHAAELYAEAARLFDELADATSAAVCWRAVLARRPLDDEAFGRAHALVVGLGDIGALDALLTARLDHVHDPRGRVALLLERADLRRSGQPRRAMDDYRAILEIDARHLKALLQLAALSVEDGAAEAAIGFYDRFTEASLDPEELRPAFLRLAELHQEARALPLAVKSLERALDFKPDDGVAIERLLKLHLSMGDANAAVERLRALGRLAPDAAERVKVEQRIAEIHRTRLKDPKGATAALVRALDEAPLALDVIGELIPLTVETGDAAVKERALSRAAAAARADIGSDGTKPAPYRALERVLGWQGDEDLRFFAAQAASLAQGDTPPARTATADPTKELAASTWERAFPDEARGVATELWRETWDAALKLYGPDLAPYGVGRVEKLNAKGIPLAWIPVDRIARALGASPYDLYAAPADKRDLAATAGSAIVLGASHSDKLGAPARFRVAYKLALLREKLAAVESLDDEEIEAYFAAVARLAGGSWKPPGGGGPSEAKIEERNKSLAKIFDRRQRKVLQGFAGRVALLGDVRSWRRACLVGAARVALAVGGDLAAALAELKTGLRDELGRGLARFAVSDEMVALRRELGLRA